MLCKEGLALKELTKNGRQFLLFWLIFLPLSIRRGPCRDLIFCRNFAITYAVHRVKSVEIFKIISCIGKPLENTLSA